MEALAPEFIPYEFVEIAHLLRFPFIVNCVSLQQMVNQAFNGSSSQGILSVLGTASLSVQRCINHNLLAGSTLQLVTIKCAYSSGTRPAFQCGLLRFIDDFSTDELWQFLARILGDSVGGKGSMITLFLTVMIAERNCVPLVLQ